MFNRKCWQRTKETSQTCRPGKTALLIADSKSIPRTGSFLKKIMPPLGPRKDYTERPFSEF